MLKKMVDDIIDKFEKDTKIANENLVNFRTTKEAMKARKRIEKHEQIRHCLAMVKDLGFDEESDEFFTAKLCSRRITIVRSLLTTVLMQPDLNG